MMITKIIIWIKKTFSDYSQNTSLKTKKESTRFIVAFLVAWLAKTILNEIPFFTQLFYISKLDSYVQEILINQTRFILEIFGFHVFSEGKFIQIVGTFGIRYEMGCLAFRHFTLFIFFILAHYGSLINKLWYIAVGSYSIMLINAFRGSLICISQYYIPNKAMTIHDVISPFLMYFSILTLWIVWANYFGKYKKQKQPL